MLRGENLHKKLGRRKIIKGINVMVKGGEVVGLLGPNGAGKTTTFHILAGLIFPDEGEVFLDGENLTHLPLYARARKGIGYLPQEHTLFEELNVYENLLVVAEFYPFILKSGKIEEILETLNLARLSTQKASSLSGGEKRRLEIARLLLLSPRFLLLDEPFTGIDPRGVEEIKEVIKGLKEKGIGILLTDHNIRDTLEITDRAYLILDGEIVIQGRREEVISHPRAIEEYFGKSVCE
ncbi:MAG TPA: LPS export ABC transporter ATP-binding protein [bacterium]|nr:LPS export ABC transporter ATP-binding protein [bacterium]HEX67975.1 LPS export ABC transporter ATP-binding protein [bacterium]